MFKLLVRRATALGVLLVASAAGASPITYDVIFTETVGSSTQSSSFVFDSATQLFSDFVLTVNGNVIDVTGAANNATIGNPSQPNCAAGVVGSIGFAIMSGTTPCKHNQIWYAAVQASDNYEAQFFATNDSVGPDPSMGGNGSDPSINYSFDAKGIPSVIGGRFSLVALPSGTVPEPGSIALLGVGLLAVANRARLRRR